MEKKSFKEAKEEYLKKVENAPTTGMKFTSVSGEPVEVLYTPDDIKDLDYMRDLGFPGEFPFTRGIHANGYRGKIWTMRQFAGFGTPEDTNKRFNICWSMGRRDFPSRSIYPL